MSSAHNSANPHSIPSGKPAASFGEAFARHFAVYGYTRRALELVWQTNYRLAIILGLLTLAAGLLVQLLIALFRPFQEGAGQYDGSLFLEAVGITAYTAVWSIPAHWLFLKSQRLFGFVPKRRTRVARL